MSSIASAAGLCVSIAMKFEIFRLYSDIGATRIGNNQQVTGNYIFRIQKTNKLIILVE